jgi:uncharacterized protein YjiS (DUF1127 family)
VASLSPPSEQPESARRATHAPRVALITAIRIMREWKAQRRTR